MLPTVLFESQRALLWVLQQTEDDGDEDDLFFLALIGFAAGLYLIYDGYDTWQLKRLVEDTPTSKVRSMAVGRVELEGTAREYEATVTPPAADDSCVYVHWDAEKREKRRDEDGNVHYTWTTIDEGERGLPFRLEDDTGAVTVRADRDDPEVDINQDGHRFTQTYGRGQHAPDDVRRWVKGGGDPSAVPEDDGDGGFLDSAMDFATDLATDSIDDTGNKRRYSERVLPIGSHTYVFGSAQPTDGASMETSEADLLEIRRHAGTDEFLISDSREERLQESYGRWGPIKVVCGLALSAICLYVLLAVYNLHELVV